MCCDLPHPLLADHVDLQGVVGRAAFVEEDAGAPGEHHHGEAEGNHATRAISSAMPPCTGVRQFVLGAPPVADGKVEDRGENQQRKEHRHASRKYSRWSTSGAKLDACTGNRGSRSHIRTYPALLQCSPAGAASRRKAISRKAAADQHEAGAGGAHHVHGDRAVFAGRRIVVVAEQQHLIHRAADLVVRSLHQSEAQIARRVFHAVEISREPARPA